MNTTKKLVGISLGLGLMMAGTTAFAHQPYGNDNRHVDNNQYERQRGALLGYDYNGDLRVSLAEFQQRELERCANDFRQNDVNSDGVLSRHERSTATAIHCDVWATARDTDIVRVERRTRWGRNQRPYVRYDNGGGLSFAELRRASYELSRHQFERADDNCDGGLNRGELRAAINEEIPEYRPAPQYQTRPIFRTAPLRRT